MSEWSRWVPNLAPILKPSRFREKGSSKEDLGKICLLDMLGHFGVRRYYGVEVPRRQTAAVLGFWCAIAWAASRAERWAASAAARDRDLAARLRRRRAYRDSRRVGSPGREHIWLQIGAGALAGLGFLRVSFSWRPFLRYEMGKVGARFSRFMFGMAGVAIGFSLGHWHCRVAINQELEAALSSDTRR